MKNTFLFYQTCSPKLLAITSRRRPWAALPGLLLIASCSGLRYIPVGEKLYTGSKVTIDAPGKLRNQSALQTELEGLVRPQPNSSILGLRPKLYFWHLGVTNQADYSTGSNGSRTDLNVAVRRQLFNNRLTVRVGSDIALSGGNGNQTTSGQNSASNLAGDVSLEYTLLADGRLRLRAFRQNAYEDIDGPIVRTGASLVFQRDYNNFKELFEKVSRDVKEERRRNRKQDKQDKQERKDQNQQLADSATAVTNASTTRRDTTRRPATSQ